MASPTISIDDDSTLPLFVRIARAISEDIARGRFRAGQKLPGTRVLAARLGVHRNTVVAAFEELESQGWVRSEAARGTFVSEVRALDGARLERNPRRSIPTRPAFDLRAPEGSRYRPALPRAEALMLYGGLSDLRLFPVDALARAYRRVLKRSGPEVLDYTAPHGDGRLRAALAHMLSETRALAVTPDEVLVTRGAQQALWLVARALLRPGDTVLVETYGYPPAWQAFADQGARLVPVAVDEHGIVIAEVKRLLERRRVRAIYLTPHHQYPTMAVLHPARRARLLELARRHRVALIEDDYDSEYHYEGRPVMPMASTDRSGSVIYIGTLSKVLAPGLRIGYVVGPRALVEALCRLRVPIDRQGGAVTERVIAELIEDGEVQRHTWRTRRVYEQRRAVLAEALRRELGDRIDFDVPPGGLALWTRLGDSIDVERWAARANELGVYFQTGSQLSFGGQRSQYARLGFARHDERELGEAVRRLRRAADSCSVAR